MIHKDFAVKVLNYFIFSTLGKSDRFSQDSGDSICIRPASSGTLEEFIRELFFGSIYRHRLLQI